MYTMNLLNIGKLCISLSIYLTTKLWLNVSNTVGSSVAIFLGSQVTTHDMGQL